MACQIIPMKYSSASTYVSHLGEGKFSTLKKLMTNLLLGYPIIKQSSGSELGGGGGGGGGQAPPLTMQISCEVFSLYRGAVSPSHSHFLRNLIGRTLTICDVGRCVTRIISLNKFATFEKPSLVGIYVINTY